MKLTAPETLVALLVLCGAPVAAMAQTPDMPPPAAPPPAAEAPPSAPGEAMPPADSPRADVPMPAPMPPPPVVTAPVAPPPPPAPTTYPMTSKFAATFYGFVEWDSIFDKVQGLNDLAGNAAIARPGTFAGDHHQMMESIRNSRLGFKLKGPETQFIKSSAIAEMDFLGNQPQGSPAPAGSPAVSESAFFTSPTFRVRHFALKMETPIVDVLAGQYWQLFGWQSTFHPNTVQMQGVPGQVYSRSPQLRLSHTFKTDAVNVEIAVAGQRPVQRAAYVPDGQAGLKLNVNGVKGIHTTGAAGTSVDALAVGVSGMVRRFDIPEFAAAPTGTNKATGWGVSADAMIPVIPAKTADDGGLTLTGSYVYGAGDADMYTGLSGGAGFPTLPANAAGMAQTYAQNVDNGLVSYVVDPATGIGTLKTIKWQSYMAGIQGYLPTELVGVRMFLSANYAHLNSPNIADLMTMTNASKMFNKLDWFDVNYFVDATSSIRFGAEYGWTRQTYLDAVKATNYRIQFSGFYIF